MTYRWSEDALAQFEKRRKEWESKGTVRTNVIAARGESKPQRGSKYNAVRTEADGIKFASKKEAKRWMDLRLLEKAGAILDLKRQVSYELAVNGIMICSYYADFVYRKGAEMVVEDTKGVRTPLYLLKSKLMLALHGIVILES